MGRFMERLIQLSMLGDLAAAIDLLHEYFRRNDWNAVFNLSDLFVDKYYDRWKPIARYIWDRKEFILEYLDKKTKNIKDINPYKWVRNVFGYYFHFHLSKEIDQKFDTDFVVETVLFNPYISELRRSEINSALLYMRSSKAKKRYKRFVHFRNKYLNYAIYDQSIFVGTRRIQFPIFEIANVPQINLSQVRQRRFDIIERAQALALENVDRDIFAILDTIPVSTNILED
jgi:hypothetical protein